MPAVALTCLPVAVTGVPVDHVADPDEDPAAVAMLAADAARVRSLVARLPRDQRAVICMHFGLGCPQAGFRETAVDSAYLSATPSRSNERLWRCYASASR